MVAHRYVLKKSPIRKAQSKSAQDALDQLNAFLNASEPEPVYWLTRLWDDQQGCLTRSLFDERVFQMFGVLTSAGIQRRYLRGCENVGRHAKRN